MPTMRKAIIRDLDKGSNIVCQFNPTDLTLTKSGSWQSGSESQKNASKQEFAGNSPVSLKVKLFFDTYAGFDDSGQLKPSSTRKDVRDYTKQLWDLLVPQHEKHQKTQNQRPSRVQFMWGGFVLPYEFFIENISEQLTLFNMDGTPVRSTVDLSLKEIDGKDYKGDTVPAGGNQWGNAPVTNTYTVKGGESATDVARKLTGDASNFRKINFPQNADLRDLKPGTLLKI
jgi:Contractile injection system tube protein